MTEGHIRAAVLRIFCNISIPFRRGGYGSYNREPPDTSDHMQRIITSALFIVLSTGLYAQAVFTSSGAFVVPAGVNSITVELFGPGGNGGTNGGGGGGGGGYAASNFNVSPGASYSIFIGTGGSGVASIAGGLGMLANAGANGGNVSNPNIGGGGAGGTGLGGQVNRTGGAGGGGYYTYFGGGGGGAAGLNNGGGGGNTIVYNGNCLTPGGAAGIGGGGAAGDGGKGAGFTDIGCTVTDPGADGAGYGGGGGGGNGIGSPGGIGSDGYCIITWSGATGIGDITSDAAYGVLANPFTDRIVLRAPRGTEQFELWDASGREVWSGANIEAQDLSHLSSSTYVLKVIDGDAMRTIRLVK